MSEGKPKVDKYREVRNQSTQMTKSEEYGFQQCFDSSEGRDFMAYLFTMLEFMDVASGAEMLAAQGIGLGLFDTLGHLNKRLASDFVTEYFIGVGGKQDERGNGSSDEPGDGGASVPGSAG